MTWAGRKSQTRDPHLHVDFILPDTKLSSYPLIVEAYLRDYLQVRIYDPDHPREMAYGRFFSYPRARDSSGCSCDVQEHVEECKG